ncbi:MULTISPECIES: hypothetical protein [Corynebacterium]|uniref:hypothetical protein n=1 Tax=Corynebacterium TaxID=1716 RepID=UPI000836EF42|nr:MULTISPECIES: hypothetical protein [Corynebacterium]MBF9012177.1 hypothetical protein [Corynebacterium phoceense]
MKIRENETGPVDLCAKLAFHTQAISELDWTSDLMDELEHQVRVIGVTADHTMPQHQRTTMGKSGSPHEGLTPGK